MALPFFHPHLQPTLRHSNAFPTRAWEPTADRLLRAPTQEHGSEARHGLGLCG